MKKVHTNIKLATLDHNIVKYFLSMHFAQRITGVSRVNINGRVVGPVTTKQKIYTLFVFITGNILFAQYIYHYYMAYKDNVIITATLIAAACMFYLSFMLNLIHIRFFNENENVSIYASLQKIDHLLDIGGIKYRNNLHSYVINFLVYCTGLAYLFGFELHFYIEFGFQSTSFIFPLVAEYVLYMELLQLGNMIYFLADRLRILKDKVSINMAMMTDKKYDDEMVLGEKIEGWTDLSLLNFKFNSTSRKNTVICLSTIIEAYNGIGKIYKFQVIKYIQGASERLCRTERG